MFQKKPSNVVKDFNQFLTNPETAKDEFCMEYAMENDEEDSTMNPADMALNHVQVLTAALNNAQVAADHAQQAASEAAAELASQSQMVGTAKVKLESIEDQLNAARVDFEATQEAAHKAAYSAQEAQKNAAEAAAHAAIPHQLDSHQLQFQSKASKQANEHESDDINSGEIDVSSNHNFG
ncbi:uncharacterized protein LOC134221925 [Armigeres subalbatus]|uniref:uncharacterized protein LOC134221925 n=1 Tax=Armigeres subalbatus TaxID=124917 RepID=UPI002ED2F6EA